MTLDKIDIFGIISTIVGVASWVLFLINPIRDNIAIAEATIGFMGLFFGTIVFTAFLHQTMETT